MTQGASLMAGKRGLVMGIANERSLAWGIAQAVAAQGAELCVTYQGDALKKRVMPLAEQLGSAFVLPADVTDSSSMDALFGTIDERWGRLDFAVHAIAFSDKEELKGRYVDTTAENFQRTMLISCYSFTEIARRSAALTSRELSLEAKALYNIGNCAFRQGQRQADSDLEKALEYFKESVGYYSAALEKEPGMPDAAHNLEVARLLIKDLLDAIKKQQEQMKEQQEKLKAVVDSLVAVMKKQDEAINRSIDLDGADDMNTAAWNGRVDGAREDQESIAGGTAGVTGMLLDMFRDQQPEQVSQAISHLDSSIVDQEGAMADLKDRRPGEASSDQQQSLEQMKKALEKLTEGEGENKDRQQKPEQGEQQPQQQEPEQQEPEQQPQQEQQARSETARDILEEEKKNREKRYTGSSGYKKVDRDW